MSSTCILDESSAMRSFLLKVLYCEPTLKVQLAATIFHIVLQQVLKMVGWPILERWMTIHNKEDKPWATRAIRRIIGRTKNLIGADVNTSGARKAFKGSWLIALQHLVAGLMCFPRVLGLWPEPVATALVRHAAITEIAYELQDYIEMLYARHFKPEGPALYPQKVVIFTTLHHFMGCCLALPMNMYYSEDRYYGMLIFLLEFAAGFTMLATTYGYTLDVSRRVELLQMRTLNVVIFSLLILTRGPIFWYVVCNLLARFINDKTATFLGVGIAATLTMSIFNVVIIVDCGKRVIKFWAMATALESAKEEEAVGGHQVESTQIESLNEGLLQNAESVIKKANSHRRQSLGTLLVSALPSVKLSDVRFGAGEQVEASKSEYSTPSALPSDDEDDEDDVMTKQERVE